jgi:16S rRNA (uracil1498-N3)-methyltransferase
MPANERMDWLVRRPPSLAPPHPALVAERSVLRLTGERAQKKQAHWQAIAVAACEQCGRNRVPEVRPVQPPSAAWRRSRAPDCAVARRRQPLRASPGSGELTLLSGPEGGLTLGRKMPLARLAAGALGPAGAAGRDRAAGGAVPPDAGRVIAARCAHRQPTNFNDRCCIL